MNQKEGNIIVTLDLKNHYHIRSYLCDYSDAYILVKGTI